MSVICKPRDIVPSSVCTPPMVLLLIFFRKELNKLAVGIATRFSDTARTCIGAAGQRAVVAVASVLQDWGDLTAQCSPLCRSCCYALITNNRTKIKVCQNIRTETTTIWVLFAWHHRALFSCTWCYTNAEVIPKKWPRISVSVRFLGFFFSKWS